MSYLMGVDGCAGGWIAASRRNAREHVRCRRVDSLAELLADSIAPSVLTVDMPIGLLDRGARQCDVEARRILGPRRSSVFTPPVRPILVARSHAAASRVRYRLEGKRVSIQTWAIVAKIREVDRLLRRNPAWREIVREVHPEVCFFFLNDRRPMRAAKKTAGGLAERVSLLQTWCGRAVAQALDERRRLGCRPDDIVDAFVALWTAERIEHEEAVSIPSNPRVDGHGLRMEIVA